MTQNFLKQIKAILAVILLGFMIPSESILSHGKCDVCQEWQSKVDPTKDSVIKRSSEKKPAVETASISDFSASYTIEKLDESTIFEAIACLLKLKGEKRDSKISGATRPDTSQIFGTAKVEIAALYYISYLFYEQWGHAGACVLVGTDKTLNSPETVTEAYESYRVWFGKVKKAGIEEARKQKIDPLANSGIRWY